MKTNSRPIQFIPTSKNFSDFGTQDVETDNGDQPLAYDLSDRGSFAMSVFTQLEGDSLLLNLLMELDDREKIILLYQVLKEMGFNLTQEQYARTLSFSRVYYTSLAKELRAKCAKIIQSVAK